MQTEYLHGPLGLEHVVGKSFFVDPQTTNVLGFIWIACPVLPSFKGPMTMIGFRVSYNS